MKCPHSPIQCAYIETAGMSQTKECVDCEHYPSDKKMHDAYAVEQLLNMLPKTIVRHHKQFWRYDEIFDLKIEKTSLNDWVISYINDMNLNSMFSFTHPHIHWCAAMMAANLIENKYL